MFVSVSVTIYHISNIAIACEQYNSIRRCTMQYAMRQMGDAKHLFWGMQKVLYGIL